MTWPTMHRSKWCRALRALYSWKAFRLSIKAPCIGNISDPKTGYTYKEVVNIYSSNGSIGDQTINVAQSNISGAAGRLDIQKGDVVYFYTHDKGVEHTGIVSSVENGQIKYSGNSKRHFDHPLEDGMKEYDGVCIVIIGD